MKIQTFFLFVHFSSSTAAWSEEKTKALLKQARQAKCMNSKKGSQIKKLIFYQLCEGVSGGIVPSDEMEKKIKV